MSLSVFYIIYYLEDNNYQMKYILPLFLWATAFNSNAQGDFNLPWNPDENGDLLVGVADLQSFLAVYGTEFSNVSSSQDGSFAFHKADQEMTRPECNNYCSLLPGPWTIPTKRNAYDHFDIIQSLTQQGEDFYIQDETNLTNTDMYMFWGIPTNGNSSQDGPYFQYSSSLYDYFDRSCLCAIQQRPKVEYEFCYLEALPGNDDNFRGCVAEKASLGWYPLGGVTQDYGRLYQAFWRWAE